MKNTKKKKQSKKLTEEQIIKRKDTKFRGDIKRVFTTAGFEYIKTIYKETKIGNRTVEFDAIYFYENILLICEDTGSKKTDKDHIRNKKEAFDEVESHKKEFFNWLITEFPDHKISLEKYNEEEYKIFNLYFSQTELNLTSDEIEMYSTIKFVDYKALNYFLRMGQCIKCSSKYEIFRFLGINKNCIGLSTSESSRRSLKAPIIYPKRSTGLTNDVRVVSFMMSAESLLSTCYVLRKDNWEDSIWLYQRLIDKDKIKKIRTFLANKGEAFYNNIIVALPDNITFRDDRGNTISINKIGDYEKCELEIPDEMNSIGIIDGQHRIFAHYEGNETDKLEKEIAPLRNQLHLLVTGLIFPETMSEAKRTQIQSEIFLDINSNSKPVQADVLLHIEMLKNPFSDIGLARQVIEKLNKKHPFLNMFEMSSLDGTKIKIASIVKFALRYLVTTKPVENKVSFYTYWNGDKTAFEKEDKKALKDYLEFCVNNLSTYFCAIKKNFSNDWGNEESKLLSVISINGFIIAYNRQLKTNKIKDFAFFDQIFKKLKMDFSKDNFIYTSSQYRKMSDQIIKEAFDLTLDE